jgi:outer membrane protein, heavy metal efflux system
MRKNFLWLFISFCFMTIPHLVIAQVEHQHPAPPTEVAPKGPSLTLDELLQMAQKNNPTLGQADASIQAAEGRKAQSNLYPNPIVGVEAQDISLHDTDGQTDQHLFFTAEQTLLLGGKRGKAGDFFEKEKQVVQTNAEMQKLRVSNSVRLLYYQILGIQKELEVRGQLQKVAEEAVRITKELYNVGSADQPDLLEAGIEAQSVELATLTAQNERIRLWKQLAAVVGNPGLLPGTLAGSLEENLPKLNEQELLETLLNDSPQVKAAQFRLLSKQSAISFSQSQGVTDLRLLGGIGYNYEILQSTGERAGWEASFGVGIPLPLFNRNQGQVAAAQADADSAEKEIDRVKLDLTAKFSDAFAEYLNAKTTAEKYKEVMIPSARQAYELYLNSFQKMQAAYPQVLIAQRNQYQLEVEYVKALTNQWIAALKIQGSLLTEGALDPPLTISGERE